jgi:predicted transcriptional regulator
MPMLIVNDSEFDSEFNKLNKSEVRKEAEIIDAPTIGRGNGNIEVPDTLRKVIGEESAVNGRQSAVELAKSFGLSPSSVSAYAVGAKSTATIADRPNSTHITDAKERVSKVARRRLMSALHHITGEKLSEAKAKDLAGVAKDMAAVIRIMEPTPQSSEVVNNGPTFVFYSPQHRKEESFDVVYAKE